MYFNKEEYLKKESERIGNLFSTKKHGEGFSTKEIFVDWYIDKIKEQKFKCYYCETSIFNIEKLIISGKLKKRKIRYGYRGRTGGLTQIRQVNKKQKLVRQEQHSLIVYITKNEMDNVNILKIK